MRFPFNEEFVNYATRFRVLHARLNGSKFRKSSCLCSLFLRVRCPLAFSIGDTWSTTRAHPPNYYWYHKILLSKALEYFKRYVFRANLLSLLESVVEIANSLVSCFCWNATVVYKLFIMHYSNPEFDVDDNRLGLILFEMRIKNIDLM